MTSNYKAEEKKLHEIIEKHVKPTNSESSVKLTIYYRNRKLKDMIIKNKPKRTLDEQKRHHVVYQYSCNLAGCNAPQYIGYTTCTLYDRFGQHTQSGSIKKHRSEKHEILRTTRRELLQENKTPSSVQQ